MSFAALRRVARGASPPPQHSAARRLIVLADRFDGSGRHRRRRWTWILREQILQARETGHPAAAQPGDRPHHFSHGGGCFAARSVSSVVRQTHDIVSMPNVENGRQQGLGKGGQRFGILPQHMRRDSGQPRVVSGLQFLYDKGQSRRRQGAMPQREQQRAAHAGHHWRAHAAVDRVTLVEQREKGLRISTVSTADLDDANEVGLRAYLLGRAPIDSLNRGRAALATA